MINYTFKITRLNYYPNKDGFEKVVESVYWILIGKDEDSGFETSVSGSEKLLTDNLDPNKYIVFENLTEDTVITWVLDAMNAIKPGIMQRHKDAIEAHINRLKSPPIITTDPPWNN